MTTVCDIYNFIDSFAPFASQIEWDNSGLLIGNKKDEVKKVLVCLDATDAALDKAIDFGAELIITHHPIIWDPLRFVPSDTVVAKAIRNKLNVISCHTNWDGADGGVNCVLSTILGLQNTRKMGEGELSMLRVGELPVTMNARSLAELVSDALDTTVAVSLPDKEIKTVAVCGGAGASFLFDVRGVADVLVTGEAKHNNFLDATEMNLSLIAAGHYDTENISMPVLMNLLKEEFSDIDFIFFEEPPYEYVG